MSQMVETAAQRPTSPPDLKVAKLINTVMPTNANALIITGKMICKLRCLRWS